MKKRLIIFYVIHIVANFGWFYTFSEEKQSFINKVQSEFALGHWDQAYQLIEQSFVYYESFWSQGNFPEQTIFQFIRQLEVDQDQIAILGDTRFVKDEKEIISRIIKNYEISNQFLKKINQSSWADTQTWLQEKNKILYDDLELFQKSFKNDLEWQWFLECLFKKINHTFSPFYAYDKFIFKKISWPERINKLFSLERSTHQADLVILGANVYSFPELPQDKKEKIKAIIQTILDPIHRPFLKANTIIVYFSPYWTDIYFGEKAYVLAFPEQWLVQTDIEFSWAMASAIISYVSDFSYLDTLKRIMINDQFNLQRQDLEGYLSVVNDQKGSVTFSDRAILLESNKNVIEQACFEINSSIKTIDKTGLEITDPIEQKAWLLVQYGKLLQDMGFFKRALLFYGLAFESIQMTDRVLIQERIYSLIALHLLEMNERQLAVYLNSLIQKQLFLKELFLQQLSYIQNGLKVGGKNLFTISYKSRLWAALAMNKNHRLWQEFEKTKGRDMDRAREILLGANPLESISILPVESTKNTYEALLNKIKNLQLEIGRITSNIQELEKYQITEDITTRLKEQQFLLTPKQEQLYTLRQQHFSVKPVLSSMKDFIADIRLTYLILENIKYGDEFEKKLIERFHDWAKYFKSLSESDRADFPVALRLEEPALGDYGDQFVSVVLKNILDERSIKEVLGKYFPLLTHWQAQLE